MFLLLQHSCFVILQVLFMFSFHAISIVTLLAIVFITVDVIVNYLFLILWLLLSFVFSYFTIDFSNGFPIMLFFLLFLLLLLLLLLLSFLYHHQYYYYHYCCCYFYSVFAVFILFILLLLFLGHCSLVIHLIFSYEKTDVHFTPFYFTTVHLTACYIIRIITLAIFTTTHKYLFC